MALAIVICGVCKKWIKLGQERHESNRYYCEECYGKRPKADKFDDLTGEKLRRKRTKKIQPPLEPDLPEEPKEEVTEDELE